MEPSAILGVLIGGFFAGNLVFVAVLRWAYILVVAREQVAATDGRLAAPGKVALLAFCQSLFHSGPWVLVVFGFFAYHIYSESWAPWFFAGFCGSIFFLGILIIYSAMGIRKRSKSDSPQNTA
jgi:uncharacterized membrane protein